MFNFHPTPQKVVRTIVRKHFPKKASYVLDPAIGDGALISNLCTEKHQLTAVDIDPQRIDFLKNIEISANAKLYCGDFLETEFENSSFDFIICNPPFNAKKCYSYKKKKIPLEAAFLIKSIEICKHGGRIIFILPSSIVQGRRLAWLRKQILEDVKLAFSYKLDNFCFDGVEGDFSVLVFDKIRSKKDSVYILKNGEKFKANPLEEIENFTFDADEIYSKLRIRNGIFGSGFEYKMFSELFESYRGKVTKNYNQPNVFHSVDSSSNYQFRLQDFDEFVVNSKFNIEASNFYIKRVSRNLNTSLSLYGNQEQAYTDCIIKIVPIDTRYFKQLFFALFVSLQDESVKKIIQKGSCATYLDLTGLKCLKIPTNLHLTFAEEYRSFIKGTHSERLEIARRLLFKIRNMSISSSFFEKKLMDNKLLINQR